MRFTKMHGAGNDYIFVNCFQEPMPENPAELARQVSDRHFGIGGDGLILICPSEKADAKMRIFNADGSEAEMCGNGIRCVAKYLYDHGLARKPVLQIETGRGVLNLRLELQQGRVQQVEVDMGEPILDPERIPTQLPGNPQYGGAVVETPLLVADQTLLVTCVSMGNPHCVCFVEELTDSLVSTLGPQIERHPQFPNRVNVEFVQLVSSQEVKVRVWERGSGETLACGTGACAVCVAGVLTARTSRQLLAHLPGGDLKLHWSEKDNHVYLTGPTVEVFTGIWKGSADWLLEEE
ncbi:MAG: diaminopimelate epimerase [Thermoguttaceae bacterium]|nr:diaminopimelate epimerase [Thermoguttaceae bacterium]MDW8037434.1 diaminopimelate epimerase [Thermoguttaceae bacterium]